ncbi:MAG: flavodoxin domain-containing protein [Pseudomonadota bacterium]
MKDIFKAIRISDHVWWVGAIDWNVRDFHGYMTKRGSTYNAYLILADKVTLMDTVRAPFYNEMMARIASVIHPDNIQYIISNHSEMDHSGCLPEVIDAVRPEKVYTSVMGAKTLQEIFHAELPLIPLKDGDNLSLGNMTLSFLETRMLHWPDSMFSYLAEEQVLFSQDAFGMHLAASQRFDDEMDPAVLRYEAATYFANILTPYAALITKLLARVTAAGLKFKIIAPDHGPVWRKDIRGILNRYAEWAAQKRARKAVVVYGTMWHSTEKMALAITEGLIAGGIEVKLMSMDACHRSDVAYELLDAGALIAGSSTLNNNMLPGMADVLTYLKGLKPKNLFGAAFGSWGWSGEAPRQIQEVLAEMKVELVGDPIQARHRPDKVVLARCCDLGRLIAEKLHEPH